MLNLVACRLLSAVFVIGVSSRTEMLAQVRANIRRAPTIVVSIALPKSTVPVGQQTWLTLSLKNVSKEVVPMRTDLTNDRIHVLSGSREPAKTPYHRQALGEGLPGEPALVGGGVVLDIAPGAIGVRRYDLVNFFDLHVPGTYSVYMDVYDEVTDQWLRTNIVVLEIEAAASH